MLHHLKQIDLCRRELQIALAQDPRLEQARKLLAQLDVGAPVSGVQTVGYVEPQPAPAAPPAPPPPAPEAQPAIVEVKPELNAGRRILPPPPIFESTPSSKPEASRVDAWESEW